MKFTIKEIEALSKIMAKNEITEIRMADEEQEFEIRREEKVVAAPVVTVAPAAPVAAPVAAAPTAAAPEEAEVGGVTIDSPIVGTFYSAPGPDQPDFAKVGDSVSEGSIVCIVEAMKVMNEIPSTVSGVIAEVLVENGQPVEYGQPIFRIK